MWLSRKTENRRKLALAAKEFRVAASLEDEPARTEYRRSTEHLFDDSAFETLPAYCAGSRR
jgi:hypothetical protein